MKPPTGGPTIGPINPGKVTKFITRTRSFRSVERNTTSRPTGDIIAPPMPCRTRARTNSVTELLRPHKSRPG